MAADCCIWLSNTLESQLPHLQPVLSSSKPSGMYMMRCGSVVFLWIFSHPLSHSHSRPQYSIELLNSPSVGISKPPLSSTLVVAWRGPSLYSVLKSSILSGGCSVYTISGVVEPVALVLLAASFLASLFSFFRLLRLRSSSPLILASVE